MINSKLRREMSQFVRRDGWFSIPRKLFALAKRVVKQNKILNHTDTYDDFSSSALVNASSF
jgi:hypothetical protein